ncbi:MAG: hypothetical protein PHW31_01990 [Candidatus Pacebacteria bacterium]|nr:hypothetical protein [Candidatus Paceibacterota bacterium]
MKYVVLNSSESGKKSVFLESNFFKGVAVFSCVKVEIKEVPKRLESLPDAELTEAIWRLENYDNKKTQFDRLPVGVGGP